MTKDSYIFTEQKVQADIPVPKPGFLHMGVRTTHANVCLRCQTHGLWSDASLPPTVIARLHTFEPATKHNT